MAGSILLAIIRSHTLGSSASLWAEVLCSRRYREPAPIRSEVSPSVVFFRAPYGNWREKAGSNPGQDKPTSVVAELLNRSVLRRSHVGPINWDISGHDYDHWSKDQSAQECAGEYLEKIEQAGRGIVLMHDSSEDPMPRGLNRTCELTRLIVPVLKQRGYTFVGLDAIPQVRSAIRVERQCALVACTNRFLPAAGTGALLCGAASPSPAQNSSVS